MNHKFIFSKYMLLMYLLLSISYVFCRPFKILFIVDKFPYYTKTVILNQVISLIDLGHDVRIFAYRSEKSEKLDSEVAKYDLLSKIYYRSLPKDLKSFDIIVNQYGTLGSSFIKLKKAYNLKAKFVTFFRGGDVTNDRYIYGGNYQDLFSQGDLFFPICDYFKHKLIILGCDPNKIIVQYSPIYCDRFKYRKRTISSGKKIRLISVCRLNEQKGIQNVIKSLVSVVKKHPNIEYVVVGEGGYRETLEKLIKKYDLRDKVKLLGWYSQEEVAKVLDTAHIFILPSVTVPSGIQEAIPNAIKEAMLMGLPVISTFHGGIAELINDGKNGFLVPEYDVLRLANKINHVMEHPEIWPIIGKNGRDSVLALFEMNKLGKRLHDIFQALFNKGLDKFL